MALSEPLTLTINAVPFSLARVRTHDLASDYQNADGTVMEVVSHANVPTRKGETGAGVRTLVGVRQRKIVADPLNAENQEYKTLGVQLVIDRPEYGFSATEVDYLVAALKAQVNTAMVTKLFGRES